MSDNKKETQTVPKYSLGRRDFLSVAVGGVFAMLTGCGPSTSSADNEDRISALEEKVSQLEHQLAAVVSTPPLGYFQNGDSEIVAFDKKEMTIKNPEGVMLNLGPTNTNGGVGIRFYKGVEFGEELQKHPWSMWIEGEPDGYNGLAILRDWYFTAALWNEDGKLLLGRLHPNPPTNAPAKARLHITGNSSPDEGPVDEVLTIIEGSPIQSVDIFQVIGSDGKKYLAVNGTGQVEVGSRGDPKGIVLHDTQDGHMYSFKVTNGQPTLTRI
jgi:hypothetical protein